jgi:hypothetical protein
LKKGENLEQINIGLGIALGLAIGAGIGTTIDAQNKKKSDDE